MLRNITSEPVTYKIKTTAPKRYVVRPPLGICPPGATVEVAGMYSLFLLLSLAAINTLASPVSKPTRPLPILKFRFIPLRPLIPLLFHTIIDSNSPFFSLPKVSLNYNKDPPAQPEKGDKFQVQAFALKNPPEAASQDILKEIVRSFLLTYIFSESSFIV